MKQSPEQIFHASTVAVNNRAVLIAGASGSGKSTLALQLISMGAVLIADDQTQVTLIGDRIMASRPATLPALIEARGVGLLPVATAPPCEIALVIDLDETESQRLPEPKTVNLLGEKITVFRKVDAAHFPSAIFVYLSSIPACPD